MPDQPVLGLQALGLTLGLRAGEGGEVPLFAGVISEIPLIQAAFSRRAGEYADVISGVREKRAELDRLIIDAKQRKIDAVLFFDLSRLTRKGIGHAIKILGDWKDAKVKPICYAYPMLDFTDDSGMGEMMAAMMAWMAAQERQMIQKRIRAGLAARKAKGGRLGRAPLPMKTVSHAQRLRETGLSYAEIGKALKISKGSAFNACKQETGA